jgi:RND family efflux transporter MFP subunit
MASSTPGRIQRIHVEPGQFVSQGQLLVEMDKTQLIQAELQLANLEVDYRRIDTLLKAGSVSQQQFDQIKTQYELAKTNVEFLRENTRLLSPFAGSVSGKYFENGEMFSGAPNTPVGKAAIVSLMQTNPLKASVSIAERFFPKVKRGMRVEFSTDIYPGEIFVGTVSAIYPQIDAATRTFRIEATLPNAAAKLRPGMFARATLQLQEVDAFVIPAIAVMKQSGTNERFVFVVDGSTARRVVVEIGDRFDDSIEIVSENLVIGDKLIIAGQTRLLDGTPINILD